MNKKALLKLEYNKIIDLLEEQASSICWRNRLPPQAGSSAVKS